MEDRSKAISRRGLFRALVRPLTQHLDELKAPVSEPLEPQDSESADPDAPKIAIIQGRFCLAYQGGMCFTCSERCPVPGAITSKLGIPTVHLDICTGCGICHDLCPAPRNAILITERKPEHLTTPQPSS